MFNKPLAPRIEMLFGPKSLGLDEAMQLRQVGRQTFWQLLAAFYPRDEAMNADARFSDEQSLGEALEELEREGFIRTYPVGNERNFYQWEYELTPVGLVEVQKVQVTQEGPMTWWRAMGTDGQIRARGQQIDD